MKRMNFEKRKLQRQDAAARRQRERDERTTEEQIAILDERFGPGEGATKEREKLAQKE